MFLLDGFTLAISSHHCLDLPFPICCFRSLTNDYPVHERLGGKGGINGVAYQAFSFNGEPQA